MRGITFQILRALSSWRGNTFRWWHQARDFKQPHAVFSKDVTTQQDLREASQDERCAVVHHFVVISVAVSGFECRVAIAALKKRNSILVHWSWAIESHVRGKQSAMEERF